MTEQEWEVVSVNAMSLLPSRWSIFWNYIIRRRPLLSFNFNAWVNPISKLIHSVRFQLLWEKCYKVPPHGYQYNENGTGYVCVWTELKKTGSNWTMADNGLWHKELIEKETKDNGKE